MDEVLADREEFSWGRFLLSESWHGIPCIVAVLGTDWALSLWRPEYRAFGWNWMTYSMSATTALMFASIRYFRRRYAATLIGPDVDALMACGFVAVMAGLVSTSPAIVGPGVDTDSSPWLALAPVLFCLYMVARDQVCRRRQVTAPPTTPTPPDRSTH